MSPPYLNFVTLKKPAADVDVVLRGRLSDESEVYSTVINCVVKVYQLDVRTLDYSSLVIIRLSIFACNLLQQYPYYSLLLNETVEKGTGP